MRGGKDRWGSRKENEQDRTAEEVRDGKGRETERQNSFTPQKEKNGHAVTDSSRTGGV